MKNIFSKLIFALTLSLFCHNQAQAISAENKALLNKIYYKAGQYGKYVVIGALTAEFGPSFVAGLVVVGTGKVIADNMAEDSKYERIGLLKTTQDILREATGGAFALGALAAGAVVLVYVAKKGGIVYPLWGAAAGVGARALMDVLGISDFKYVCAAAEEHITTLLTEE